MKDKKNCKHIKVFQNIILTSYPAQQKWICALCGLKGTSRDLGPLVSNNEATYEDIEKLFKEKE